MKTTLLICLMGLFSSLAFSGETDSGRLSYTGTRGAENMSLQTETMRTEYRWVQVPYQERVCRNETRYRRECRQEPPRRVCRTVNKPVCRIERQCRSDRNGRQVCRRVRVCRNRPVRVCRDEPGRRICRDVPYQHRVCRMETRYRQERRAYQVVDSRTAANLSFNFVTVGNSSGIRTDIGATLNREYLTVNTEDFSSPQRALLYRMNERREQRGSRDLSLYRQYEVTVVEAASLFAPINEMMAVSEINSGRMAIEMGRVTQVVDTQFRLRVTSGPVLIDRALNPGEYRMIDQGTRSSLVLDLRALLGGDYTGRTLTIELTTSIARERLLNGNQFSKFTNLVNASRVWR